MRSSKSPSYLPLITRTSYTKQKTVTNTLNSSSPPPEIEIPLFGDKERLKDFRTDHKKLSKYAASESCKSLVLRSETISDDVNSRLNFFSSYQNLPKESERVAFKKTKQSPELAFLKEIYKEGLTPRPLGIFQSNIQNSRARENSYYDLRSIGLGDTYAKALSKGIKHTPHIKELNLKENRLTEKGVLKILSQLVEKEARHLVLAGNHLGEHSMLKLVKLLDDSISSLKRLSLENTKLSETAVIQLCSCLKQNVTLRRLNLAKNEIKNSAIKAIGDMLITNEGLQYLDLHWNLIRGESIIDLFNGIKQNKYLKHLDLSWNALGSLKNPEIIKSIGKAFQENTTLLHVDLSYNSLNTQACEIIGSYLCENHTLIGLHMLGNDCKLNAKGFIIPMECTKEKDAHNFQRVINEPTFMIHNEDSSNCWICERWVEVDFSLKSHENSVYLHLECDGFIGDLMEKNEENFHIKRVVPPGILKFFYSGDSDVIALEDTPTQAYEMPIEITKNDKKIVKKVNVSYAEGISCNPKKLFKSQIRIPGTTFDPKGPEDERIKWEISISSFRDYKFDTEETLKANFEFDFKNSRIHQFVKDTFDVYNTKEYLERVYLLFKETYRHLAALSGNGLYYFGPNIFTDFLSQCNVFDENFGINDLGVCWNATKGQRSKNEVILGNRLSKSEFMEIITRIACDKYIRNNLCKTTAEALQKLFEDSLIPVMIEFNTNNWRMEKYCCEDVDLELKVYKPIFDEIFRLYTGKSFFQLKGQMTLEEFRSLCVESGLCIDAREIEFCAYRAIMCHKEEILEKKRIGLSYVEFLEAICRVFDQGGSINDMLRDKIRARIHLLINLCPESVRESFIMPTQESYLKLMYKKNS